MSVCDCENGKRNWVADIKDLLSKHGYAYVFNNPSLYDVNTLVSLFKHTLIDMFKQTWCNDKAKSGVLKLYDNIKNTLDYEQYLNVLPHDLRCYVTRCALFKNPYW